MEDEDEPLGRDAPRKGALQNCRGFFFFSRTYRWSVQAELPLEQQPICGSSSSSSCGQILGQALPQFEATAASLSQPGSHMFDPP